MVSVEQQAQDELRTSSILHDIKSVVTSMSWKACPNVAPAYNVRA